MDEQFAKEMRLCSKHKTSYEIFVEYSFELSSLCRARCLFSRLEMTEEPIPSLEVWERYVSVLSDALRCANTSYQIGYRTQYHFSQNAISVL
jgi:hypothetical protein